MAVMQTSPLANNPWDTVENVERIFASATDCIAVRPKLKQFRLNRHHASLSPVEHSKRITDIFSLTQSSTDFSHSLCGVSGHRSFATLSDSSRVLELYALFACGRNATWQVQERTVSYASRLSLVVSKSNIPDVAAFTTALSNCLFDATTGLLVKDPVVADVPTGVILEGDSCYYYHFPTVMVYRHERKALLSGLRQCLDSANVQHRDHDGVSEVYNSHGGPVYLGLTVCGAASFDLHFGSSGSFEVNQDNLEYALPFLCSVNPVGSVLNVFRLRGSVDTPVSWWTVLEFPNPDVTQSIPACASLLGPEKTWKRQLDAVTGLACIIKGRLLVEEQRTVGQAMHGALNGTYFGFAAWILFLQRCGVPVVQQWFALLQEWRQFSKAGSAINGTRYLHCIAQQDDPVAYDSFVDSQRREDHRDRLSGSDTDLVSLMGSMTHVDLANFVCHELRHKVCCTLPSKSEWWVYKQCSHRWMPDNGGTSVMLLVYRVLQRSLQAARCENADQDPPEAAESDNGQRTSGRPNKASLAFMVNFPCSVDADRRQQACTLHLDSVCGDIRNIQNVMRAMHMLVYDSKFLTDLDTKNDHLIPFSNGVLDVETAVLRQGVPDDLLHRGPTYEWVDFDGHDSYVLKMEYILTTTFPDSAVRAFVLEVFASLLRKRNRYKHFYILSGNTNGGKSFLLQILNAALGNLFCTIPVTAITARESDPSGHSEYLARTTGVSVCVCNEPDTSTQKLLPDKLKLFTSDSDRIPVRELYGQTREMPITWKLMMACNTPPALANCDAATVERTIFITFSSTFADARNVPKSETEQFAQRLFAATKDYTSTDIQHLGRALMMIMFTTYVRNNMHTHAYTPTVPRRLRLETEQYLFDMQYFQNFCFAFLRPSTFFNRATVISRELDWHLTTEGTTLLKYLADYEMKHGRQDPTKYTHTDRDASVVGSPAWVSCQCRQTLTLLHKNTSWGHHALTEGAYEIAMVDIDTIVNSFMAFRTRVKPQHALYNNNNQGARTRGNGVASLEYSVRMKLDPGLVRQIIRRVVGREPFQDMHLGVRLIAHEDTGYSDLDQPASHTVRRALLLLNTRWIQRFGVPIPHPAFVDLRDLRQTLEGLALRVAGSNSVGSSWSCADFGISGSGSVWKPTCTDIHMTECPITYDACAELMQTHQFYIATQLRTETDTHKLQKFVPGFTRVGTVKANTEVRKQRREKETHCAILQPAVLVPQFIPSAAFEYESH